MNGSSSGTTFTSTVNNGDKFNENNNKYDLLSASNEKVLIPKQPQQSQQQYSQHNFVNDGQFPASGTQQLRRTQSIISQNLRDQQYQLYCSGSSPPLQQQYGDTVSTQLQQKSINNTYGLLEDAVLYGNDDVDRVNILRHMQQQQIVGPTQQRLQQYSTTTITTPTSASTDRTTTVSNLHSGINYLTPNCTKNTATIQHLYNKQEGMFDGSIGDSSRINCQQQTYQQPQQKQEFLYQPYQPEYNTYQQQQLPYNQLQLQFSNNQQSQPQYQQYQQPQQQQPPPPIQQQQLPLLIQQQHQQQQQQQLQPTPQQQQLQPTSQQQQLQPPSQQQLQPLSQQQQQSLPQQQYNQPPNQIQYQRLPNQDLLIMSGEDSQHYVVDQQQRVDNSYTQNISGLTLSAGLMDTSNDTKYSINDATTAEPNSTSFRPLQKQLNVSNLS